MAEKWVLVLGLGVAFGWPFHRPNSPPPAPVKPSAVWGAKLYHRACLSCHGPRGDGEGLMLLPDGTAAPRLDKLNGSAGDEKQIAAVVAQGRGQMPGWKSAMTPAEIQSVSLYVSSLNRVNAKNAPPPDDSSL